MAKIGYIRCSTTDQNPARQEESLKNSRCEKVFSDMLSGKDTNRPGLKAMLEYVREGDILYTDVTSRCPLKCKEDEINTLNKIIHINICSDALQVQPIIPVYLYQPAQYCFQLHKDGFLLSLLPSGIHR